MSLLSPDVLLHVFDLEIDNDAKAAAEAIIKGYLKEFSAEGVGQDLWALTALRLTAPNVPHIERHEEREHWVIFFEYTKALLMAVERLYGEKGG